MVGECLAQEFSAKPMRSMAEASSTRRPSRGEARQAIASNAIRLAAIPSKGHVGLPGADEGGRRIELATVAIVTVELATFLPSSVRELELNEQVTVAGRVPHEKFTLNVAPFSGVTFTASVPDCPALRFSEEGTVATLKSGAAFAVCVSAEDVLAE